MIDTFEVETTFNFKNGPTRIIPVGVTYQLYKSVLGGAPSPATDMDLVEVPGDTHVFACGKGPATQPATYSVRASAGSVTITGPSFNVTTDPNVPTGGDASLGTPQPRSH